MKSTIINEFDSPSQVVSNIKPKQVPFQVGLPNNEQTTDYMNACIVGLCSLKKLVGIFGSNQLRHVVEKNDQLIFHFSNLVKTLYCNNASTVDRLKHSFRVSFFGYSKNTCGLFNMDRREDPKTFLVSLIGWLRDDLNVYEGDGYNQVQLIQSATSLLDNFHVKIKRKITCSNGHLTINESIQRIIEVGLDEFSSINMDNLIEHYFGENNLNGYRCSRCRSAVKAVSRNTLTAIPEVIVVVVRLFEEDNGYVS
jgi:ubiquitin C-terminal hydrolase